MAQKDPIMELGIWLLGTVAVVAGAIFVKNWSVPEPPVSYSASPCNCGQ